METTSFWKGTAPRTSFPRLETDAQADAVILGGGITGITAACLLSRAGRSVVVLESGSVGGGTTGYSTGNLYATVDSNLYRVREKWSDDTARDVARSRIETIGLLESLIAELGLRCGFERVPQYLIATDQSQLSDLERELGALHDAGVAVERAREVPVPLPVAGALRIDAQAQFHPLLFVQELARAIESPECRIFERSRAAEIDEDAAIVATDSGAKVRARHLVMATHTPKGFHVVQTELGPYREYAIAGRLRGGAYPVGIFWDFAQPGHSIRSYDVRGEKYLIVIGEKHKTGQHGDADYYAEVEEFTRAHFDLESVAYRWSAQHYRSADLLPFIGKSVGARSYVATGFATNGLVYGALAAAIITDDITGRENRWAELYRAARFTPLKSAGTFAKENIDVAKQYARDYLTRADVESLTGVGPGDGALVEVKGTRYAVYRSHDGQLTVLSPKCTHLRCIVHWNALENTWDCPCHGSRFQSDGSVIEGPAIGPLERVEIRE